MDDQHFPSDTDQQQSEASSSKRSTATSTHGQDPQADLDLSQSTLKNFAVRGDTVGFIDRVKSAIRKNAADQDEPVSWKPDQVKSELRCLAFLLNRRCPPAAIQESTNTLPQAIEALLQHPDQHIRQQGLAAHRRLASLEKSVNEAATAAADFPPPHPDSQQFAAPNRPRTLLPPFEFQSTSRGHGDGGNGSLKYGQDQGKPSYSGPQTPVQQLSSGLNERDLVPTRGKPSNQATNRKSARAANGLANSDGEDFPILVHLDVRTNLAEVEWLMSKTEPIWIDPEALPTYSILQKKIQNLMNDEMFSMEATSCATDRKTPRDMFTRIRWSFDQKIPDSPLRNDDEVSMGLKVLIMRGGESHLFVQARIRYQVGSAAASENGETYNSRLFDDSDDDSDNGDNGGGEHEHEEPPPRTPPEPTGEMMNVTADDEAKKGKTGKRKESKASKIRGGWKPKVKTIADPKISSSSLEDSEIQGAEPEDVDGQEVDHRLNVKKQRTQEEDPSHGGLYQTFEGTGLRAKSDSRVEYGQEVTA